MSIWDSILKVAAPVGGFLLGGPAGAAAGAGLAGAVSGGKKADKATKEQMAIQQERYNAGAPYRAKLPQLLASLPSQRENLDSIFADSGNPYSRTIARPSQFQQDADRITKGGGGAMGMIGRAQALGYGQTSSSAAPMSSPIPPMNPMRQSPGLTMGNPLANRLQGLQGQIPGGMLAKIMAQYEQRNTATPQAPVPGALQRMQRRPRGF